MDVSKDQLMLDLQLGQRYYNGFSWFTYMGRPAGTRGTFQFTNQNGHRVNMSYQDVNINFYNPKTSLRRKMELQ